MSLIWDEINDSKTLVAYIQKQWFKTGRVSQYSTTWPYESVFEKYARDMYWKSFLKKFLNEKKNLLTIKLK